MSKHPIKVFTVAVVTTFIFAPLTMQAAAKTVMTGKKIPDYLAEGYAIKGIWGSKIEADYSAGIYEPSRHSPKTQALYNAFSVSISK